MPETKNVARKMFLHVYPSLKFGYDSERNVFWIVSSLIAFVVTTLLITETALNWYAIIADSAKTIATAVILIASFA